MAKSDSRCSNRELPKATDDAGLWRLKGGAAAYAYDLRRFTTTNLTPDQIHQIGLKQVDSIQTQMDKILRQLGRTGGSDSGSHREA